MNDPTVVPGLMPRDSILGLEDGRRIAAFSHRHGSGEADDSASHHHGLTCH